MSLPTISSQASPTLLVYGRRTGKTISSSTTNYLYDGANIVQELSGTTPTANLLSGSIDEVFTRTDSNGTANFLTDVRGSTLALTDSSGNTLAAYSYEPFGNAAVLSGSSMSTYEYAGRENDGAGLYFYRARYYDPTLQRFISEDPIGFGGGQANLYAYVGNSPLNSIDPTGMDGQSCVTSVGPGICDSVSAPLPPAAPCMTGRYCGDTAPQNTGTQTKPQTPWYQNPCVTGALEKGALAVSIDGVGVFSPLLSRGVGNFIGWSGIVATQQGGKALNAFGVAAGISQVGFGVLGRKSSWLGNTSTALGVAGIGVSLAGLSPGVGQAISAVSAGFDIADTIEALSQCK